MGPKSPSFLALQSTSVLGDKNGVEAHLALKTSRPFRHLSRNEHWNGEEAE